MTEFTSLQEFCECMKIEKSAVVKVLMPRWWTRTHNDVVGYTDNVDTHCCDITPAVFVWVPEFDYSGYFHKKDLDYIGGENE